MVSGDSQIKQVTGFLGMLQRQNLTHSKINFELKRQMEFLKELWTFLRTRKKLWLAPIIIVMLILGGLLMLAQGSVVAPFIYTLF